MSLNVGESGKLFGYNTNFDLSSNTQLDLKFTDPDGTEINILFSRITAPASNAVFDEKGIDKTYLANEFMQFTINATDFTLAGEWKVCGVYTNTGTTPDQIYHGEEKVFTVGEACK